MPWDAIQYVSSGITLVAFIAAIAAWIYRYRILQNERLIRTAPENERSALVERALEIFSIDTKQLSRQQQYDLALEQIRGRAARFRMTSIVVVIIAILAVGVTTFAIFRTPSALDDESQKKDEQLLQKLEGQILDAGSGESLPSAIVMLPEYNLTDTTDQSGRFEFQVLATHQARVSLKVMKKGYITRDLDPTIGVQFETIMMHREK